MLTGNGRRSFLPSVILNTILIIYLLNARIRIQNIYMLTDLLHIYSSQDSRSILWLQSGNYTLSFYRATRQDKSFLSWMVYISFAQAFFTSPGYHVLLKVIIMMSLLNRFPFALIYKVVAEPEHKDQMQDHNAPAHCIHKTLYLCNKQNNCACKQIGKSTVYYSASKL